MAGFIAIDIVHFNLSFLDFKFSVRTHGPVVKSDGAGQVDHGVGVMWVNVVSSLLVLNQEIPAFQSTGNGASNAHSRYLLSDPEAGAANGVEVIQIGLCGFGDRGFSSAVVFLHPEPFFLSFFRAHFPSSFLL